MDDQSSNRYLLLLGGEKIDRERGLGRRFVTTHPKLELACRQKKKNGDAEDKKGGEKAKLLMRFANRRGTPTTKTKGVHGRLEGGAGSKLSSARENV